MGDHPISPIGQFSEAISLTDFMNDRLFYDRAPHGKYIIQSHILSRVAGGYVAKGQEKLGDITWRIDVI
ncbi:hypothetical protein M407DRAFT_247091 [Tulasnella calospora MUT 4182]|uniref:Uncharacterized protein n=1 Tax=Tulasnella calospora MUT 4182 TaxID=1051891 RepID=A0A0C3Q0U9_9AGAM|nr:hypothetical protein M407DRAFT_247091 [Tulasnella calospora MUT 4182]